MGAVALVLGVLATVKGLGFAVELTAGVITILSLATLVLAISPRGSLTRSLSPNCCVLLPREVRHV